tara:strand:+ start:1104 stop:2576 length:1473 start_codon:yes stop_codon:yes gene_type:complete
MKKYILLFVFLSALGAIYLIFPIKNIDGFVSIEDQKFKVNDTVFYPIALNFITSAQTDGESFWVSSYKGYNPNSKFVYKNKTDAHKQLQTDMDLIKEMGFNTVRIVGAGEAFIDEKKEGALSLSAYNSDSEDTLISLYSDEVIENYLNSIEELLTIIDKSGLKAIFLLRIRPEYLTTEHLLKRFCIRFKGNTSILAIDIYNEPLYFDKPEKQKDEVFNIVNRWREIIKMYAPNHLVTIGLEGIREVFRWDPNIINVDFISYHPYEYEPEQVRNEIAWYGKYTEKPWIIGETAIPADNDSITYEEQRLFAKKTLDETFNYGGIGYSWWQYKDVDWHKYHANFMGLLTWNGKTTNSKGETTFGEIKSTANVFKGYIINIDSSKQNFLPNYYNYSENSSFQLIGKIVDNQSQPIEGAVILAWNENWTHSYHTITKKDGSFSLLGSYPFYHWMASATRHTTVRGELNPENAELINSLPTLNLEELQVLPLTFLE